MTAYFDRTQSAAYVYGDDAAQIIRLLGSRFMGENPAMPFVWRTFRTNGIACDRLGCYQLDFDRIFPSAEIGSIVYAAADLYCPRAKSSAFFVTCGGPVRVWLNGDMVFESNGNQERSHEKCRVQVSLNEGFNRFVFRCECTRIGFGCGFANAMPQWEPCNYVLPWREYAGEAGIAYTQPVPEDMPVDMDGFWGDAMPQGLDWLPTLAQAPLEASGLYALWCMNGDETVTGIGTLAELRGRVAALREVRAPFHIHGRCTTYLVAGPLTSNDPAQLSECRPGQLLAGVDGPVTWQPDMADTALRPYVESQLFGRWTYPLGVTLYGMWRAGLALNEPALNDYVLRHVRQVTGIHDYALYDQARFGFPGVNQQICWLDALDDCGSFASMMLECTPNDADSRRLADRIARYMLDEQPRTAEGAYRRRDDTIWADDMYMSGPFLCRYSALTGDDRAINECAEQLLHYQRLLFMPEKNVMAHMRCLRNGEKNGIPWCRGNGWVLFTLSELLMKLPAEHPRREALLDFFRSLTAGYMALQDATGLWHQLLDGPETYLEASATAMFICAFARGLRYGWYPADMQDAVRASLERAWRGLTETVIDRSGNLYGVCRGSGFSFSRAYYRRLMWNFNDTHGIGIVMLAGVEYLCTVQVAAK